ncbi:MAG TPA: hypothetical protein VFK21_02335 [Gammaproteobacteria bacterium]|nr:hypothetical protein [Gammaproteobacteria bacterium]
MHNRIRTFLRSMAPFCGAVILTAFGGYAPNTLGNNATGTPATAANTALRDGSHDFDFLYGKWMMPNHRLKNRLAGSNEWEDFVSYDECHPLPGGIGNEDFFKTDHWKDFMGVTVRTYDKATGLWRLYWVDNYFSGGVFEAPVVGKFEGNVGVFEAPDTFNGKPIIVRFTWTVNPKGSKAVANWEQAFSADGGKTWETNWKNEIIPMDDAEAAQRFGAGI